MNGLLSGYREIEHTADTAIFVWGPDLPSIFIEAVKGMNDLMGIQVKKGKGKSRTIALEADDVETLLVNFLEEVVFLTEHNGFGTTRINLDIGEDISLNANLYGASITKKRKEIKAVTFHNLQIQTTLTGFEATIVFDV